MAKNSIFYGRFLSFVVCLYLLPGSGVLGQSGRAGFVIDNDTAARRLPGVTQQQAAFRSSLREIFRAELGVREATGNNDGERVETYLAYTGLGKGYEWCAAFVSWCYYSAGRSRPRNPWSPALFPRARVIWTSSGTIGPLPQCGDVFGIWNSTLNRIAHVGFVEVWGASYVVTVEGNSGDAVQRRRRVISSIYKVADWAR